MVRLLKSSRENRRWLPTKERGYLDVLMDVAGRKPVAYVRGGEGKELGEDWKRKRRKVFFNGSILALWKQERERGRLESEAAGDFIENFLKLFNYGIT